MQKLYLKKHLNNLKAAVSVVQTLAYSWQLHLEMYNTNVCQLPSQSSPVTGELAVVVPFAKMIPYSQYYDKVKIHPNRYY